MELELKKLIYENGEIFFALFLDRVQIGGNQDEETANFLFDNFGPCEH
jgi:hypothetical protein